MMRLAAQVNMPYVCLTLDVGAAMDTWKSIWNFPDTYSNVLINLEDFHFIKENISLIGKLMYSSGFEDAVFQAKLRKKGSLNGDISSTHYNRSWVVHSTFSEAFERLLLERFLNVTGKSIPTDFILASQTNVEIDMQSPANLEFVNDS